MWTCTASKKHRSVSKPKCLLHFKSVIPPNMSNELESLSICGQIQCGTTPVRFYELGLLRVGGVGVQMMKHSGTSSQVTREAANPEQYALGRWVVPLSPYFGLVDFADKEGRRVVSFGEVNGKGGDSGTPFPLLSSQHNFCDCKILSSFYQFTEVLYRFGDQLTQSCGLDRRMCDLQSFYIELPTTVTVIPSDSICIHIETQCLLKYLRTTQLLPKLPSVQAISVSLQHIHSCQQPWNSIDTFA